MIESLFTPRTIAVVGASRTPGKVGHELVANLLAGHFAGKIVPVNPSTPDILGIRCHPTIKAAATRIDLSLIAVPPPGGRGGSRAIHGCGRTVCRHHHGGFQGDGRRRRTPGTGPGGAVCGARSPPAGSQLPGRPQPAPRDERVLCQAHAEAGLHRRILPVGRAVFGHPGLGGWPRARSVHTRQHGQQGGPQRERLSPCDGRRPTDQGDRGLPRKHCLG
jgi:hypothetical protein